MTYNILRFNPYFLSIQNCNGFGGFLQEGSDHAALGDVTDDNFLCRIYDQLIALQRALAGDNRNFVVEGGTYKQPSVLHRFRVGAGAFLINTTRQDHNDLRLASQQNIQDVVFQPALEARYNTLAAARCFVRPIVRSKYRFTAILIRA